jgi:hypothetical protein
MHMVVTQSDTPLAHSSVTLIDPRYRVLQRAEELMGCMEIKGSRGKTRCSGMLGAHYRAMMQLLKIGDVVATAAGCHFRAEISMARLAERAAIEGRAAYRVCGELHLAGVMRRFGSGRNGPKKSDEAKPVLFEIPIPEEPNDGIAPSQEAEHVAGHAPQQSPAAPEPYDDDGGDSARGKQLLTDYGVFEPELSQIVELPGFTAYAVERAIQDAEKSADSNGPGFVVARFLRRNQIGQIQREIEKREIENRRKAEVQAQAAERAKKAESEAAATAARESAQLTLLSSLAPARLRELYDAAIRLTTNQVILNLWKKASADPLRSPTLRDAMFKLLQQRRAPDRFTTAGKEGGATTQTT